MYVCVCVCVCGECIKNSSKDPRVVLLRTSEFLVVEGYETITAAHKSISP